MIALTGCSTALRLGYNQGPTLALWWADRYVDFDSSQSTHVRSALNEWFSWHRKTQLEDLEGLARKAQAEASGSVTPGQICRWTDELSDRLMQAYEHAIPAIAEIAPTLHPDQLKKLERRFEKNNEDFRDEYLQPVAEDRLHESIKRTRKRAEDFYGPLNTSQQLLVRRWTAESPFDPELWLSERRARQQDILSSLRRWITEKSSPDTVRNGLRALGQNVRQSSRENYRSYQKRLFDYNCAFMAEFHNATTPTQRQRLHDKLRKYEVDLHSLIGDIDT
ncbi:MAG: DUF6279 family lipoprotein [Ideonella sp.]